MEDSRVVRMSQKYCSILQPGIIVSIVTIAINIMSSVIIVITILNIIINNMHSTIFIRSVGSDCPTDHSSHCGAGSYP